jgi:hypothetical protein
VAFRDRLGDEDDCPFAKALGVGRGCPENRVSGDAARRPVTGRELIMRFGDCAGETDGEDLDSFNTSFREVFVPLAATCQGDADLESASLLTLY